MNFEPSWLEIIPVFCNVEGPHMHHMPELIHAYLAPYVKDQG